MMKALKQLEKWSASNRAARLTVGFFAGMLLFTLVVRGTAGAAMARVELASSARGTIVQSVSASAVLCAEDGEKIALPAGITVEKLWVAKGQIVKQDDPLLQLDIEELQTALEQNKVQLMKLQAQLAQLNAATPPSDSGVVSAQTAFVQAAEDADREKQQAGAALEQAKQQKQTAEQAYADAVQVRDTLNAQTEPLPTEEERAEAERAVQAAYDGMNEANMELSAAENALETIRITAQRKIESAQTALNEANTAYEQAQQQAALEQQTSQADAAAVNMEIKQTKKKIKLLETQLETNGIISAPRRCQILDCGLVQGSPCPEQAALALSKENSPLLAQFTLPKETTEKVKSGQTVQLSQKMCSAKAAVQTVMPLDGEEVCEITAVILEEGAEPLKAELPVSVTVVLSQTEYENCVPLSAVREDAKGTFVLIVEQEKTIFGVTNTAVRLPVTVLEVDSDRGYAAIAESVSQKIIAGADRAVRQGASVRIET